MRRDLFNAKDRRGTGIKGGFNPTKVPGCILWVRADQQVTTASGNVRQWNDLSGFDNHLQQLGGLLQPRYHASGGINNLPFIGFLSDSRQTLSCVNHLDGFGGPIAYVLWMVLRWTYPGHAPTGATWDIAGHLDEAQINNVGTTSTASSWQVDDGASTTAKVTINTGVDYVMEAYCGGSQSFDTIRLNGGSPSTSTNDGGVTGWDNHNFASTFGIGDVQNSSFAAPMSFYELAVYDRNDPGGGGIGAADRAALQSYAHLRYGNVANGI